MNRARKMKLIFILEKKTVNKLLHTMPVVTLNSILIASKPLQIKKKNSYFYMFNKCMETQEEEMKNRQHLIEWIVEKYQQSP